MPEPSPLPTIVSLGADDEVVFFAYLNAHLADNGRGATALFQPMARAASQLTPEKAASFSAGMARSLDEPGWRRVWVAQDGEGGIGGHVDLRARAEPYARHRAQLGMGVRHDLRGRGLGARLLQHALAWATAETALAWIDLEVLAANAAAVRLYQRHGFVHEATVEDMFRIDGEQLAFTRMHKRLLR